MPLHAGEQQLSSSQIQGMSTLQRLSPDADDRHASGTQQQPKIGKDAVEVSVLCGGAVVTIGSHHVYQCNVDEDPC